MSRCRPAQRDNRGVASVEFAAVALVLLVVLQIVMDTAWQVASEVALEHGAHDALRFAITGSATVAGANGAPGCRAATIVWLVTHSAPGVLQPNNLTVSSSINNAPAVGSGAPGFAGVASQTIEYIFVYKQPYLTPFARMTMGASFYAHQVSIVAENEPYPTQPC